MESVILFSGHDWISRNTFMFSVSANTSNYCREDGVCSKSQTSGSFLPALKIRRWKNGPERACAPWLVLCWAGLGETESWLWKLLGQVWSAQGRILCRKRLKPGQFALGFCPIKRQRRQPREEMKQCSLVICPGVGLQGQRVIWRDIRTPGSVTALFTTANTWKQPECSLTDGYAYIQWSTTQP